MAWKASLRKSKYGKGPNAESETNNGIAAGNNEDDNFERLVQIVQAPDQSVFGIMKGDHTWLGNHESDNDRSVSRVLLWRSGSSERVSVKDFF